MVRRKTHNPQHTQHTKMKKQKRNAVNTVRKSLKSLKPHKPNRMKRKNSKHSRSLRKARKPKYAIRSRSSKSSRSRNPNTYKTQKKRNHRRSPRRRAFSFRGKKRRSRMKVGGADDGTAEGFKDPITPTIDKVALPRFNKDDNETKEGESPNPSPTQSPASQVGHIEETKEGESPNPSPAPTSTPTSTPSSATTPTATSSATQEQERLKLKSICQDYSTKLKKLNLSVDPKVSPYLITPVQDTEGIQQELKQEIQKFNKTQTNTITDKINTKIDDTITTLNGICNSTSLTKEQVDEEKQKYDTLVKDINEEKKTLDKTKQEFIKKHMSFQTQLDQHTSTLNKITDTLEKDKEAFKKQLDSLTIGEKDILHDGKEKEEFNEKINFQHTVTRNQMNTVQTSIQKLLRQINTAKQNSYSTPQPGQKGKGKHTTLSKRKSSSKNRKTLKKRTAHMYGGAVNLGKFGSKPAPVTDSQQNTLKDIETKMQEVQTQIADVKKTINTNIQNLKKERTTYVKSFGTRTKEGFKKAGDATKQRLASTGKAIGNKSRDTGKAIGRGFKKAGSSISNRMQGLRKKFNERKTRKANASASSGPSGSSPPTPQGQGIKATKQSKDKYVQIRIQIPRAMVMDVEKDTNDAPETVIMNLVDHLNQLSKKPKESNTSTGSTTSETSGQTDTPGTPSQPQQEPKKTADAST